MANESDGATPSSLEDQIKALTQTVTNQQNIINQLIPNNEDHNNQESLFTEEQESDTGFDQLMNNIIDTEKGYLKFLIRIRK